MGAKVDGWIEHFSYEKWIEALENCGLKQEFYAQRERSENEVFPWEHLEPAISRKFLWNEYQKALSQTFTSDCRRGNCTGCGVCQQLGVDVIDWGEHNL